MTSDNDIVEKYTVNPTTGALDASTVTNGKQIILTTSGSYSNGFPLTNNSASVTTNGAYMVIKPGTHTLKVRYWVKDVVTDVEGAITKTYSSTAYASNTYYDMAADLNVKDYRGDKYYMWDAQQNYWAGHEWNSANPWQPVLNDQSNSNYAQNNSDPRYYNDGNGSPFNAIHSCATLQMLTSCLGIACMVIHVGTVMNYGLQWGIYTKAVCGLRRSPYSKAKVITAPRNLPMVQPTCVQHGRTTTTTAVVSTTLAFLPQQTQAATSTCPPWVTTTLVG